MSVLWALVGLASFIALGFYFARRAGQTQEKLSKEEEINAAVEKALLARDRLRSDAAFASRVRARFRR